MARLAGKMRGDMRAMEEQSERMNPVSGRGKMRGCGATPSMGLSQFRGGMRGCGDSESDEELVGGMTRRVGAGRKKKGMSEAMEMGLHLGKHLHSLHGAGWWDDFKSGFNSVVAPVAGVVKNLAPLAGPEGMAVSGAIGALGYGRRRGCRGGDGTGAGVMDDSRVRKVLAYDGRGTGAGPFPPLSEAAMDAFNKLQKKGRGKLMITHGGASNSDTGAYHGHGRERDDAMMTGIHGAGWWDDFKSGFNSVVAPVAGVVKNLAPMAGPEGMAVSGALGALGYGRRKRAPAGPNDGRRKRAEVVRKVMREQGLSMIEASKYVKAHGLY